MPLKRVTVTLSADRPNYLHQTLVSDDVISALECGESKLSDSREGSTDSKKKNIFSKRRSSSV